MQTKEKDMTKDSPIMTKRECQCNYTALANYQVESTSLETDINASINNCKHLHLPSLRDMGSPRPMTDVLNKLDESIRSKRITIGMTLRISKEVLKEYITSPSK